jgi:hypothetical protein
MIETLDLAIGTAEARWKRAVDVLWREVVWLRRQRLEARERERVRRRLQNLRKIVRKALADYHRVAVARQRTR